MADSPALPFPASQTLRETSTAPRHSLTVRLTHWIATLCFLGLLVSGIETLITHPRFYWGEAGNLLMAPLFTVPIPASRASVPTGYNFVLKDQNSWARSLHFQAAWLLFFAGTYYLIAGLISRHFSQNLFPRKGTKLLGRDSSPDSYNPLQRLTYLTVIFVLFPLMFWTGLAMSPAFVAVFPLTAASLGGQQSARTIHFFGTLALVLFFIGHVAMVCRAGFVSRTRALINGRAPYKESA
ncbi:MAG: cytochrome b/b6 domain-containing protein [Bryobacterales bacterium]|nr:cytochrome b/b6 domain-containing protein [Bryobacterales bacterium]